MGDEMINNQFPMKLLLKATFLSFQIVGCFLFLTGLPLALVKMNPSLQNRQKTKLYCILLVGLQCTHVWIKYTGAVLNISHSLFGCLVCAGFNIYTMDAKLSLNQSGISQSLKLARQLQIWAYFMLGISWKAYMFTYQKAPGRLSYEQQALDY